MENSNEFVLAQWLSGKIDEQTAASMLPDVDLENLKLVLKEQEKLDFGLYPSEAIWEKLEQDIHQREPKSARKGWIPKVLLAIIVLCITLLSIYILNKKPKEEIIKTEIASTITHELLDGSIVKLAPQSTLNYAVENWATNRIVRLKGQAFFDVESGSSFKVQTETGSVQVLGTEFEVFELGDELIVSCFEGSVQVASTNNTTVILSAQEKVSLNKSVFSAVETIYQDQADFLNGFVKYKDISARLLLQEIQRFYNLKVESENIDLAETFSGIIATTDIDKTCTYIAQTFGWTYQVDKGTVTFRK